MLSSWADGDGRRALGALETAAAYAEVGVLDAPLVKVALQTKGLAFDKGGEHFYNLLSALHKSVRGCDPDAALYWLARLLVGGADLMTVARRLVRIASEDVGASRPERAASGALRPRFSPVSGCARRRTGARGGGGVPGGRAQIERGLHRLESGPRRR